MFALDLSLFNLYYIKRIDGTLIGKSNEAINYLVKFNIFWIKNFYFSNGKIPIIVYNTGSSYDAFLQLI